MMEAGRYAHRFEWLQHSFPDGDGFGDKSRVRNRRGEYESQGYLWGSLEDVISAAEEQGGSTRNIRRAVVRLRNAPGVVAPDRLRDVQFDEVWEVESTHRTTTELICEVKTP